LGNPIPSSTIGILYFMDKTIKSSKVSLKFSNMGKLSELHDFIEEYTKVAQEFVDMFWPLEKLPKLIDKEYTSRVDTWLSARSIQASAKQASGIVRGTKQKFKQRQYIYDKLILENRLKVARKLKITIDKNPISKPELKSVNPELDSRFITIELENNNSFEGWLNIGSLGNEIILKIPFKKTKHFNKMLSKGTLKQCIRLSKHSATLMFEMNDVNLKMNGSVEAVDVGILNVITCSDSQASSNDLHGWNLKKIQDKMKLKKKGSKNFKQCQSHRDNYINWSINQLNLKDIKTLKIENIKDLRRGRRNNRYMSHWTYTTIFDKLNSFCHEQGVLVEEVDPRYRSQRCFKCGWTSRFNRQGKLFRCKSCGHTADADLNASLNIRSDLSLISKKELSKYKRKLVKGFSWNVLCQECIVPDVQTV
jgi:IS605 OrfB family transposase